MHVAKWKKLDLKLCILCDSIYVAFWKRQKYREGKQISGCRFREREVYYKGIFRLGGSFCIAIVVVDTGLCEFVKTPKTIQHKEWLLLYVNFLINRTVRGSHDGMQIKTSKPNYITDVCYNLTEGVGGKGAGLINFGKQCFHLKLQNEDTHTNA